MYKKYIKRIIDLIFSLAILPIVLLIIGLCSILIKFDDQGPVFYKAKRLGKNGKIFIMYKIRTMKVNSPDLRNPDGSTYNAEDDPRLTRIGKLFRKFSIDELPQLFNVIKGDMSIIGPRPDLPEDIHSYTGNQIKRIEVLPGISGYSQAFYRNSIPTMKKIENDIYYVDNISFVLDIKIIFQTVKSILLKKNVYTDLSIYEDKQILENANPKKDI